MNWTDKFEALQGRRTYAELERKGGITEGTLSNKVREGTIPLANAAIKIARALDVDVEWLFDDEQGLPPIRHPRDPGEETITRRELGQLLVRAADAIEAAVKLDRVALRAEQEREDKPPGRESESAG